MKKIFLLTIFLSISSNLIFAQITTSQKAQAEQQLGTMTPEEIDAAIKKYGLTRAEAEARASAVGIDLEKYLKGLSGTKSSTTTETPSAIPSEKITQTPQTVLNQKETTKPTDESNISAQIAQTTTIKSTSVKTDLFGSDYFKSVATGFEPTPSIADKEYVIGAGDMLKVSLWGEVDFTDEFTVDKDGRIYVKNVGPIFVSGYTLEETKNKIKIAMSKSFAGLISSPARIFFDLSISKLRPIRVFFMGEVEKPGGFLVNNFASVFNSLFAVGGIKPSGSLRDVQVFRNGKIIARLDLYNYFLGAINTNDIRVNDNDIIFVPLRNRSVKISGPVLRQNSFELLPKENLQKVLEFAGGINTNFYLDKILVDRIIPFNDRKKGEPERKILSIDFDEIVKNKKDFTLEDGDAVTVYPILDLKENFVTIEGDVKRPYTYELKNLNTIQDLINIAEGLLPSAYLNNAELIRTHKNNVTEVFGIDLNKVLTKDPNHNLQIQSKDKLRIFSINDAFLFNENVSIYGSVKKPGIFQKEKNLTLTDLILRAGGFNVDANIVEAEISRAFINPNGNDSCISIKFVNLPNFTNPNLTTAEILKSEASRFKLQNNDVVFIRKNPNYNAPEIVTISGEVKFPGSYSLSVRGETIADLIDRAGGILKSGFVRGGKITRSGSALRFNLENAVNDKHGNEDLILMEGDMIDIPFKSQTVSISGNVNNPGTYAFNDGENMNYYIERAGELADSSDFALVTLPEGFVKKISLSWLFGGNPKIPMGTSIFITRKIPEPKEEIKEKDTAMQDFFREQMTYLTTILSLLVLAKQL